MFLQLALVLELAIILVSSEDESIHRSQFCGGILPFVKQDDLPEFEPSKYMRLDPKDFIPLRILYVYDRNMSEANRALLEKTGEDVNERLSRAVRGPKLTELRRARESHGNGKGNFSSENPCFIEQINI